MFGFDEWVALGAVAAPMLATALSSWQTNAVVQHNAFLARITGMAAREAATIGRVLAGMPPGAKTAALERSLVATAVGNIATEMAASTRAIGASDSHLRGIVQGELAKVAILAPAAIAMIQAADAPAAAPASVMDTGLPGGAFARPTIPTPVS